MTVAEPVQDVVEDAVGDVWVLVDPGVVADKVSVAVVAVQVEEVVGDRAGHLVDCWRSPFPPRETAHRRGA